MTAAAPSNPDVSPTVADAPQPWPLRPWLLAGLLGVAGLLIWAVTGGRDTVPWEMATAAFLFFGAIAAAFTIERDSRKAPAAFGLAVGVVMAGLAWRAIAGGERYADEEYGFMAGAVATALALPLFQSDFHRRRLQTPYAQFHDHVWTDAISAAGALAFTGLSWLVLVILGELFALLRIDLIKDLIGDGWFGWTYSGLAAGAALGTIRNELRLLGTLRTIAVTVLSLLAVPVAAALALFLAAMVVSGPQVLWEATRSATPVLLACAAGAFVLANVIVRSADAEMQRSAVMRWAALVLALVILPLTVFAAVSMGTRVAQHGLSPERLWALVAIAVACAAGLAFFIAVLSGVRGDHWRDRLRATNLYLAMGVCAVALVLALPIFDFGAISARNQVARLQSGAVEADAFDYAALRWDFGDAGRRALARLARSENALVAESAQAALDQTARIYRTFDQDSRVLAERALRVQPEDAVLRRQVLDFLAANPGTCQERCVALELPQPAGAPRQIALVDGAGYQRLQVMPDGALVYAPEAARSAVPMRDRARVEIGTVPRRHVLIDGVPVGPPLDDAPDGGSAPLEASAPPR